MSARTVMDAEFLRLAAEFDELIVRNANEEQARVLVDRFAADLEKESPSTTTAIVALAALVRGILPIGLPLEVSLTSFARVVACLDVVRHPDGSPVYHGEQPAGLLQ